MGGRGTLLLSIIVNGIFKLEGFDETEGKGQDFCIACRDSVFGISGGEYRGSESAGGIQSEVKRIKGDCF